VLSLARLLAHAETRLGDAEERRAAPVGDLAGLARAYRRLGQATEALECLDLALEARTRPEQVGRSWTALLTTRADAPDPRSGRGGEDRDTLLVDRARLLRRLGRHDEAFDAWRDIAIGGGMWAGVGWIEVAKILEHRRRDHAGALDACSHAAQIAQRARFLGRRLPQLEADLAYRRRRLTRKVATAHSPSAGPARHVAIRESVSLPA
jgi:tetratricopeptide (TPR) repeat protein